MNKCHFIGRVTKDIELKETQNGTKTCAFNIAVDRPKNKDGVRGADFPQIVAWEKRAELCARYLHKGDRVGFTTHCQTRSYDKDGHRVYVTEFVVDEIEFLTPRGQQESEPVPLVTGNVTNDGFMEVDDESLPF